MSPAFRLGMEIVSVRDKMHLGMVRSNPVSQVENLNVSSIEAWHLRCISRRLKFQSIALNENTYVANVLHVYIYPIAIQGSLSRNTSM
jgi:hypothetical protein